MKTQKFFLAAALLLLGVVSCQKDAKVITHFTAGMETSPEKTDLVGEDLRWTADDQVMIYSSASTTGSVFTATPWSSDPSTASLTGTIAEGAQYTAIYPTDIAVSATSVRLPDIQVSTDGSLDGRFPMYAKSDNTGFEFKNLCGALKLHIQRTNCTISKIEVQTADGNMINGTFPVTMNNGVPTLGNGTGGHSTTTLILTTPQPVDDGHDFYIYLPAKNYSKLLISIYQTDGHYLPLHGTITINRSKIHPITVPAGDFKVPPYFTIGTSTYISFAKGNLKYNYADNGFHPAGTWTFFDEQYEYQQGSSVNTSTAYTSLFCWGYDGNTPVYNEKTTNSSISSNLVLASDHTLSNGTDWGTNPIYNAGNQPNIWRTPTQAEWQYLLDTRTNHNNLWGVGRIKGTPLGNVDGCFILPDNWVAPEGITFRPGDNFDRNQFTLEQWTRMEAAGAVFLPTAGYREKSQIKENQDRGFYWSSTKKDASDAYAIVFDSNDGGKTEFNDEDRDLGKSVRLVRVIEIPTNK